MRRAAVLIFITALAFAFIGCRDISTALHDIYTITLFPGENGAVNGERSITLKTDIRGRITKLPIPQKGEWIFECEGIDDWGFSHQDDYEPGACGEVWGCDLFTWTFVPDTDSAGFIGWQTGGGSWVNELTVFEANTPIFAIWPGEIKIPGSVAAQIAELYNTPELLKSYTINVKADEEIAPQLLYFGGRQTTITIKGERPMETDWYGAEYQRETYTVLSLASQGAMFRVSSGVTLVFQDVELHGYHKNDTSIIVVESGAAVRIENNVMLAYNTTQATIYGGAVTVFSGGDLNMTGGLMYRNFIQNPRRGFNRDVGGGGVWVRGGTFNMSGGRMVENVALGGGGAVKVSHGGIFNMRPNTEGFSDPVLFDNSAWTGGGVFVGGGAVTNETESMEVLFQNSTFNMYGGFIEDNFSPLWGGGIAIINYGRFNMHGGDILLNTAGDGGGIDNDSGVVMIYNGWIWQNQSLSGGSGGITNWWTTEMWGGVIGVNEGGFGGGVRNFGQFNLFAGDIVGNIGNGGPAGGVLNLGYFEMHGGTIAHNVSNTSQGGGIFHGISGDPYTGQFVITNGLIWNNRDLTIYHADGLPGSHGNIRVNTSEKTFFLARPGFFSLSLYDWPDGWDKVTMPAPVFAGGNPDEPGRLPTGWRDVHWYIPPMPVKPRPESPDGTFLTWTIGRPRIEVNTINNPGTGPTGVLVMDTSVAAIDESTLNKTPDPAAVYGTIPHGGTPRGGTWFPLKLATAHTTPGADIGGYGWVVRNGHLEAMTFEWETYNFTSGIINLSKVEDWPNTPSLGYVTNFFKRINSSRPLTWKDVWPWDTTASPSLSPGLSSAADPEFDEDQEMPLEQQLLDRIQRTRPDLYDRVQQLINKRSIEITEWPVPALELQIERRGLMYIEPRLEKRLEDLVNVLLENQEAGRDNDGGGIAPLKL